MYPPYKHLLQQETTSFLIDQSSSKTAHNIMTGVDKCVFCTPFDRTGKSSTAPPTASLPTELQMKCYLYDHPLRLFPILCSHVTLPRRIATPRLIPMRH